MNFEEDDETFEWRDQDDDSHVPTGLKEKWRRDEAAGLKAGVCRACGFPFTQEDLTCRHCDASIELPHGTIDGLKRWLLRTPFGIMTMIAVVASLLFYLVLL